MGLSVAVTNNPHWPYGGVADTLLTRALSTQSAALQTLLPFNDAAGLVATDISGNARHGAYSAAGVTYDQSAPDTGETSVSLDPTAGNTYIDVYNAAWKSVPATGQWSFMICAKKAAWGAGSNAYWANIMTDNSNRIILGEESGDDLRFFTNFGGTSKTVDITTPTGLDWYVCIVVADQTTDTVKLFINGELVHTHTAQTGEWAGDLSATLTLAGAATQAGSNEHTGSLYGFGLWSAALTDAEAIYITEVYTAACYADVAAGNNSNSGLTSAAAVADLVTAFDRLVPMGGNIYIDAPIANPITSESQWNQPGSVDVRGLAGATWYIDGGTAYTAGWGDDGGGVWSRALASDPGLVAVTTIDDGNGYATLLTENTGTPATPSAGEYGHNAGTLYVHLPGSASANSNTIKVPSEARLIYQITGDVTLRDLIAEYSTANNILAIADTLTAIACTSRYSAGSGFETGVAGIMVLTSCTGEKNMNDGFGAHGTGTFTLSSCIGRYNEDEGASPHDTSVMTISGGRYNDNASGGITAVNTSVLAITSSRSDNNGSGGGGAGERGGINFVTDASGSITDTEADNNTGEGVYINTSGSVTITNLDSHDNTLPDVIP